MFASHFGNGVMGVMGHTKRGSKRGGAIHYSAFRYSPIRRQPNASVMYCHFPSLSGQRIVPTPACHSNRQNMSSERVDMRSLI
jgi:hypothetical protein